MGEGYNRFFSFDVFVCDMCSDEVPALVITPEASEYNSVGLCFDCLELPMDWYNENAVRSEVSEMIDEILTEDVEVWQELADL